MSDYIEKDGVRYYAGSYWKERTLALRQEHRKTTGKLGAVRKECLDALQRLGTANNMAALLTQQLATERTARQEAEGEWNEARTQATSKQNQIDGLTLWLHQAQTDARNWKTAAEANRDAAMGYQDRALGAEREARKQSARLALLEEVAKEADSLVPIMVRNGLPLTKTRAEQWRGAFHGLAKAMDALDRPKPSTLLGIDARVLNLPDRKEGGGE